MEDFASFCEEFGFSKNHSAFFNHIARVYPLYKDNISIFINGCTNSLYIFVYEMKQLYLHHLQVMPLLMINADDKNSI